MKVDMTSMGGRARNDEDRAISTLRRRPVLRRDMLRMTRFSVFGAVIFISVLIFAVSLYVLNGRDTLIDPSKYQVVYLINGQAYFGKLQNVHGEYLVINSPYTAQTAPQQASDKEAEQATTLLRVRDQVYGPEDAMSIKSSQVVFWQNLRDDSKVTQALKSKQ
ncbi:hypothetical protein L336_0612 [Candidatus Saccharimonas aalborgensis]|jgi:hypothetical protein|uniref:Uncharacterized protein n=1 Tax=Candidatus Saccharimonas aalborgensis TaxID=1332188 RepID=R4PVP0_9BACT|nr:hypothetical protein [Candidatus Saccharimonas aalborgensis]AGL62315.1 hypothetical protein L336_0612 [Candidatus Saccharimonas aalborgensis]QQR51067.1 MAG: hypothetical protein IPF89_04875 [Candidatus Saccharibacteria bacterium]QQS68816.1 MAG: hypothetical protein IPP24_02200 [Candidatus Saccharibacteria bacterium]QQS71101.1 MAG: hypothetical protein IPP92_02330 [Candidatus Saccharibacteria bacterium]